MFFWTETGLAFLNRSWTEMPGTPAHHLQVQKMVFKFRTSFYERPFNNTTHYHYFKRYHFSCLKLFSGLHQSTFTFPKFGPDCKTIKDLVCTNQDL